jgi:hypothetical protein
VKALERDRFEFLKERKRLRDELQLERRRKALRGLEIPAKTQPPRRPRKENPLPGDFKEALWGLDSLAGEYLNALSRADRPSVCENLRKLDATGANPGFILSLLMYLWNEDVDPREHKSANVQHWQESLASIPKVKDIHKQFITKVPGLETRDDAENFDLALLGMEDRIEDFMNEKDFRDPEKKHPPDDKTNRGIFTICEYVRQKTGRPQWQTVLDLLVAAGAIKMEVKKPRKLQDTRQSRPKNSDAPKKLSGGPPEGGVLYQRTYHRLGPSVVLASPPLNSHLLINEFTASHSRSKLSSENQI